MTHHHHHNSLIIPIIIFFLISFYYTHILITNPSFNAQHYQKYNLEALVVKKIRFLLDPKNLNTRKSRNEPHSYHFSPSPSPSPSPSTSPVPSPAPAHAHAPHHHRQPIPHAQNVQKRDNKGTRGKRVLTAVIVSVGTLASVLFAMGLFFVCRKFKKQRRRPKRSKIVSKFLTSQSSVKKVSSDPGADRFYLNSIETVLEPEKCCLKLDYDTGKILKSESCSGGECSVLGEISTVNEITELIKSEEEEPHSYKCLSGEREISEEVVNDEVIDPEETHSSDDESFHSFVGSSSSQRRLSNASAFSVSETSEIISEDASKEIPQNNPTLSTSSSNSQPNSTPPPPPPPPSFSLPSTSKVRMKCNLPNVSTLKAPSAIPPPPCPPPLTKGHVNFSKVPPPPLQLPQQIPLGKDGTPLAKLKPLHWDKVRAAPDRSTVWDKLRSSSFEFDEEMIESLFGYNFQNSVKNDEMKSKTPSPSKHVLEPKRLQNITILSKALSVTVEQVCGALIRGDGLPLQDLEALSKMMPTKEEETALTNYKGDIRELGSAEKLVKVMLKIPFAFARIEAMLYRESFKDEVLHLRKSFSMLEEACKELRSSRLFLKLLEAVLKTGNRMNVGTIRGGAKAFKLDALLKLADVKGTDGKTTLLHFVVQEIIRSEGIRVSESIMGKINQKSKMTSTEEKEEHYRKMGLDLVTGLSNELCNVKKTATIDLDVLASSVANLRNGLNNLQHLVQKDMILEENKGNFVNSLRSFLKYGEMQLKELQEDENRVLLHVREITEYFHGNVSKEESNPLRIFVIVRDFLSMLDHVCKELRSSKVQRSPNPLAPFR